MLDAAPLDLEEIRRAIAFKVKKGLPLFAHDWLSAAVVENRGIREIILMLADHLILGGGRAEWTLTRVVFHMLSNVMSYVNR